MPSATWRLLETYGVSPAVAMGLDEVLLLQEDASAPTLRLYSWQPEAISLGYFQSLEEVPAARSADHVVRRLTGGGAIHHHRGELTFSIALGANDPAYSGSIPESYERPHAAIMRALTAIGVPGVQMRREAACASDVPGTGMCFHHSTSQDICWPSAASPDLDAELRKGVGTAQRRIRGTGRARAGRILHHGSIKVSGSELEPETTTVSEHVPAATILSVAEALKLALGQAFGVSLMADSPSEAELESAEELGARYGSREFLERRRRRSTRRA